MDDGLLMELSDKGNLTVNELKNTLLKDYAGIFVNTVNSDFTSIDILIFENGDYTIYASESPDEASYE